MSDSLLLESVAKLLADKCTAAEVAEADAGEWPDGLWQSIETFGLPLALLPEDQGGFGVIVPDAFAILRLSGELALPLPLAETMIANWLLGQAGLAPMQGPATVIWGPSLVLDGGRLSGTAARVPWGRSAGVVAVVDRDDHSFVVRLGREGIVASPGTNIAHEPRDGLRVAAMAADFAPLPAAIDAATAQSLLAAARCNQMAGAMGRIADMSAAYAQEREQFGRPLAKFQAIQQNLAVLAGHVAAAQAAAELAGEAAEAVPVRRLAVAAAKLRTGEAAGAVAAIAHQVHGAMGFTLEYQLQALTRRLWSWRDEYGNEAYWAAELGREMARAGSGGLWAALTAV